MTWHQERDRIKALSPQERMAGYLVRVARLAELGVKLRLAKEDNEWTEEESKEWENICDEIDPWFYALTNEENIYLGKICNDLFSALARGEMPDMDIKS